MKKITATIKPYKLAEVYNRLSAMGVRRMIAEEMKSILSSITTIPFHAYHKRGTYRKRKLLVEELPMITLLLVVEDEDVERIISTILDITASGREDDGHITVHEVEQAINIRTLHRGKSGNMAI